MVLDLEDYLCRVIVRLILRLACLSHICNFVFMLRSNLCKNLRSLVTSSGEAELHRRGVFF